MPDKTPPTIEEKTTSAPEGNKPGTDTDSTKPPTAKELRDKSRTRKLSAAGAKGGKESGKTRRIQSGVKKVQNVVNGKIEKTVQAAAKEAENAALELVPVDFALLVHMLNMSIASTLPPKYALSPEEAAMLTESARALALKYGANLGKWAPEFSFVMFLITYVGNRIGSPEAKEDQPEGEKA